jgi:intracellular multiplication protein IcmE
MAGELKNLSTLFKNTRTRAILIVTTGLIALGVIAGIVSLKNRLPGPSTSVELQSSPGGITSIPGGFEQPQTAEYAKLQTQQNSQQAQKAQSSGGSAVPTIISSSTDTGGWQGGGLSSLNQPQSSDYLLRKGAVGSGQGAADSEALPVYDPQGSMMGLAYGNANGKLCLVGCAATGSVSPDGLIRDAKGNIIGRLATSALGTPVYDAQGRLIGYAGGDGKVRDLKGNPIGTIGPNGVFKTNTGQIGSGVPGVPIYNADGRLVGYAGPDGVVHGLNGNVIGKLGPDGVARDMAGREIGKAETSRAQKGSPVYNAQGRLLGSADSGGVVRNSSGKVIGSLGVDGSLRDANGNVIGNVGAPPLSDLANTQTQGIGGASTAVPGENDQLQATRLRQAQQLEQQRIQQNQQQLVASMTAQQSLLFAAWATAPTQQYVEGDKSKDEKAQGSKGGTGVGGSIQGGLGRENALLGIESPPFVKAGAVLYAALTTGVNSDEPGPVMATIVGTQFRGAKLLGTLVNQGEKVMLTFNVMTLPDIDKSISINAVAIDANTARTALSSNTDNHYLLRYGSLFASALMQGYGQAILQSGAVVVSNGLNTVTTSPTLSNQQQLLSALGTVGQNWGAVVRPIFNTPPTVQVYSGTGLGILFLADVAPPMAYRG